MVVSCHSFGGRWRRRQWRLSRYPPEAATAQAATTAPLILAASQNAKSSV